MAQHPPGGAESPDSRATTDTPLAQKRLLSQDSTGTGQRPLAVSRCQIVALPRINDVRGNLTFVEGDRHIPFAIKRLYYVYDVPGGSTRGGHAHRTLQQFIIAMSGSLDVLLYDGTHEELVTLNRSYYGLYIPSMIWRELVNFSSGSVCAVLASDYYDEQDYIRHYSDFIDILRSEAVQVHGLRPGERHP